MMEVAEQDVTERAVRDGVTVNVVCGHANSVPLRVRDVTPPTGSDVVNDEIKADSWEPQMLPKLIAHELVDMQAREHCGATPQSGAVQFVERISPNTTVDGTHDGVEGNGTSYCNLIEALEHGWALLCTIIMACCHDVGNEIITG